MNWYGEHVLILGLGNSGLAAARWLSHRGADLRVADSAAQPVNLPALLALNPEIKVTTGEFSADDFDWADRIIISPGVPFSQVATMSRLLPSPFPVPMSMNVRRQWFLQK